MREKGKWFKFLNRNSVKLIIEFAVFLFLFCFLFWAVHDETVGLTRYSLVHRERVKYKFLCNVAVESRTHKTTHHTGSTVVYYVMLLIIILCLINQCSFHHLLNMVSSSILFWWWRWWPLLILVILFLAFLILRLNYWLLLLLLTDRSVRMNEMMRHHGHGRVELVSQPVGDDIGRADRMNRNLQKCKLHIDVTVLIAGGPNCCYYYHCTGAAG